jgi:hypothetical protein
MRYERRDKEGRLNESVDVGKTLWKSAGRILRLGLNPAKVTNVIKSHRSSF